MELSELKSQFELLTGFQPMLWQSRFYLEYFDRGKVPAAADIPTGLGKTAITALWLIAIRAGRELPRRLVYVVDRRAVVDQATTFVESMRQRLSVGEQFPISTLRGKHADNREWLDDPSKPAIIIGTVDMVGSRLLFEGYGVSRKMRSYHAGFLSADTLIVLDEAHLIPPFERLLESIENSADSLMARDEEDRVLVPALHLLSLSATGRERQGEVFRLAEEDLGEDTSLTRRRLNAAKSLTISNGEVKTLPKYLAETAWDLTESGMRPLRCLVYCNSRDQAEETRDELAKLGRQRVKGADNLLRAETELFIGARRGHERESAADRLREFGFLAGSEPKDDSVRFLVATSAGEVGVDLDADHMACDLVAWDRMVQRLGRVNRRGGGSARIAVIDVGPFVPKTASATETQRIKMAHRQVRTLVEALPETEDGHDASPRAIRDLKQHADAERRAAMEQATTPVPLRPALTRALLDAWSMTSLKTHAGRPEVAPWLRGWVDDKPQTVVLWRAHLPVPAILPELENKRERRGWQKDISAYFEATPPHVSEQLETETYRVADWLVARAKDLIERAKAEFRVQNDEQPHSNNVPLPEDIVAIALNRASEFSQAFTLRELANAVVPKGASEAEKKHAKKNMDELKRDLVSKTLVVCHTVGGLSETGTLEPNVGATPTWLGDLDEMWEPEARKPDRRAIQWSVVRLDNDIEPVMEGGWRKRFQFALTRDDEGEVSSCLAVYKWKQAAANEDDRAIGKNQSLGVHQGQAAKRVREIGERLNLPGPYIKLLSLAAGLHDEGKQAKRWQRAFNAPAHNRPYAKTQGPVNVRFLDGYRHEFGSLFHAEQDAEFKALSPNQQDLVLHLIAAHHGNARPTIVARGCDRAPPSELEGRARDVALRFARLQRRWGPWGLAWWESLLRAADQQASKDNERGEG
ncbi:MAG TPA: type I-U CRISPR-associated helicase/endonuclease Cas3 [Gammaproteobacteria bacterium]|nr:type I-U CRISPR-associated helicase/endonuclease Cas3 [Gammaproteobacteria bacterium]